jgi:hypothetical protein
MQTLSDLPLIPKNVPEAGGALRAMLKRARARPISRPLATGTFRAPKSQVPR